MMLRTVLVVALVSTLAAGKAVWNGWGKTDVGSPATNEEQKVIPPPILPKVGSSSLNDKISVGSLAKTGDSNEKIAPLLSQPLLPKVGSSSLNDKIFAGSPTEAGDSNDKIASILSQPLLKKVGSRK